MRSKKKSLGNVDWMGGVKKEVDNAWRDERI